MKEFRTILFATDFSQGAISAFEKALSLSLSLKAKLLVLHVISEPVDLRGFYVPHISFEKLEQEFAEGAERMMAAFVKEHLEGVGDCETIVSPGLPHDEIIKTAKAKEADVIVLGTHGRTGLDHVLFGSTAEKVVRKSPIPVLTVRIPN
ncbi:MAG: universal stress protein [Desulfuromonas sp.]|mgnify:CR=1 FL=1|nr:MAG: universal stress protein [Desulfuromonas sp.]